uniref:RFX-type winged-helix domain-containing protein n=1 Tax=Lepeophtheirus salmonis TaxID=72036 RepID=A0A0K2TUZ8_LEPSM
MNSDGSILEDISTNGLNCESELASRNEVESLSKITSKSPNGSIADASYIGEVEEGQNPHSITLNAPEFCSTYSPEEDVSGASAFSTALVNNDSGEYSNIFTAINPLQHTRYDHLSIVDNSCTYTNLEDSLHRREVGYNESTIATITLPSPDSQHILSNDLSSKKNDHSRLVLSKHMDSPSNAYVESDSDFQTINSDFESNSTNMSHATRVSPATIEWLVLNYETSEGVSIPRSTLYQHYQDHCRESQQEPVNAASFGKLIRSVFLGLRTRRIGTRGNSKYHYYGIRVKSKSGLSVKFKETDFQLIAPPMKKRCQNSFITTSLKTDQSNITLLNTISTDAFMSTCGNNNHFIQYFDITDNFTIDHFPNLHILKEQLPAGLCESDVSSFESIYYQYCLKILKLVQNGEFNEIEEILMDFWPSNSSGSKCFMDQMSELKLIKLQFNSLFNILAIQQYIQEADLTCYQKIVDIVVPNVLLDIPGSLTQILRNFGKNMETWMKNSLVEVNPELIKMKMSCIKSLNLCLKRYTGLNHLAQATRAVLANSSLIQQMDEDLSKIDFDSVRENCGWICDCNSSIVKLFEEEFKSTLKREVDLETWAKWLEDVIDPFLGDQKENSKYFKASRQFLLRWSFYSSMVLRDLTLRSALSFGSFHLIRLLFDEYLHYAVEKKVAAKLKTVPMALVIGLQDEEARESHDFLE